MGADRHFFIEMEVCSLTAPGGAVAGEVALQKKEGNRFVSVLADGGGEGIISHTSAQVASSMAATHLLAGETSERTLKSVHGAFGHAGSSGDRLTLSFINILNNPSLDIVRSGSHYGLVLDENNNELPGKILALENDAELSHYEPRMGMRVVLCSNGIVNSGKNTKRLPQGWGNEGITAFCREMLKNNPELSARDLSYEIVRTAEINDLFQPRDDLSCIVAYFRRPRKMIISTGPPFNKNKDEILAHMLETYPGKKIVCGGTTAKIISRELGRDLEISKERDKSGLPPAYMLDGFDMVTEGVLTLTRVRNLLAEYDSAGTKGKGLDHGIAGMMLAHDVIEFVVGTCVNPLHQDPKLPVELELRRNIVKDIAALLENKFMKQVKVQYI